MSWKGMCCWNQCVDIWKLDHGVINNIEAINEAQADGHL